MTTLEEREIDLQDLIYRVLLGWRQLLVWMLVGALLLGAFGYRKAGSVVEASDTEEALDEVQKKKESLADELTDEEMEDVQFAYQQAKQYQSMIEQLEEYYENSIRMKEDPSSVPTMVLQYSIDNHYEVVYPTIEKNNNISQIQQAYQAAIASQDVYQAAADAVGAGDSSEYIAEVISVSQVDKGFSVTISYVDEEGVRAIAEAVKQAVADAGEEIRGLCGDFDIVLNGETYQQNMKQDLLNEQFNVLNQLSNYRTTKANLTVSFSEAELEYLELLEEEEESGAKETQDGDEETAESEEETSSFSVKTVVKYALLGAVIGIFLGCCYLAFRYILAGRLCTVSDVTTLGLQNLGAIPVADGKRRPLDGVDRLLEKIVLGSRRDMTTEKALALVLSYLEVLLNRDQRKQVMITGTDWSKDEKNLAERLQAALSEAGFEVKLRCGLLSDEEAIREASAVGNVVLLEKFGRTRFAELGREKEILSANQLTVLGVVTAEPRLA